MITLWMGIALLLIIALGFIIYPLRDSLIASQRRSNPGSILNFASKPGLPRCARNDGAIPSFPWLHVSAGKLLVLFMAFGLCIISLLLYYYLGNSQGLRNAQLLQSFNIASENNIKNQEILETLIAGLQSQVKKHPNDPITIALIGKIYFSLADYHSAEQYFSNAYQILPDDPDLLIDYATADYLADEGVIDPKLTLLLDKVKKLHPTVESLSLLANVAFLSGDKNQAVLYWQEMQTLLPKDSELYQELTLMINHANQQ